MSHDLDETKRKRRRRSIIVARMKRLFRASGRPLEFRILLRSFPRRPFHFHNYARSNNLLSRVCREHGKASRIETIIIERFFPNPRVYIREWFPSICFSVGQSAAARLL